MAKVHTHSDWEETVLAAESTVLIDKLPASSYIRDETGLFMYLTKILSSEMSELLSTRRRRPVPSGGESRSSSGSRRGTRNTGGTNTPPNNHIPRINDRPITFEVQDLDELDSDSSSAIVDLTQDSEVVDLTQSPVVCLGDSDSRNRHRRAMHLSQRVNEIDPNVVECSSDEDDLQILPVVLDVGMHTSPDGLNAGSSDNTTVDTSPVRRCITCPVCMDDEKQIKSNRRHLVSTVCGHIFCNKCIVGAIQSQHRCPACRKKISMRQFHPIFL
ncbi:E3 ubiquitin-protein ligase RNF4-like [Saccoglossus kowalevskii]